MLVNTSTCWQPGQPGHSDGTNCCVHVVPEGWSILTELLSRPSFTASRHQSASARASHTCNHAVAVWQVCHSLQAVATSCHCSAIISTAAHTWLLSAMTSGPPWIKRCSLRASSDHTTWSQQWHASVWGSSALGPSSVEPSGLYQPATPRSSRLQWSRTTYYPWSSNRQRLELKSDRINVQFGEIGRKYCWLFPHSGAVC